MKITLQRVTFTPESPTYGVLLSHGLPLCVTLERPWMDNKTGVSCVPPGDYRVTKFTSPSKGDVFLLHDVPDRTMIEIHIANKASELEGCIAVGRAFFAGGITTSGETMKMLLETMPDEFTLSVINP
jgi:hypothetical protein